MIPRIAPQEWRNGIRHLPLTEEQVGEARAFSIARMEGHAPTPDKFTCDTCLAKYDCVYAFDYYNTDGDCLAEK